MLHFRLIIRAEAKDHEKACLYIEKGKRNTGRESIAKKYNDHQQVPVANE
jgi:hypothetical protein